MYEAVWALEQWPRRYPVAEAVSKAKGHEIRRMNYSQCALFYRMDDDRGVVELLAFRHGRRNPWADDEPDAV